jgi:hypothetical protein
LTGDSQTTLDLTEYHNSGYSVEKEFQIEEIQPVLACQHVTFQSKSISNK